MIDHQRPDRRQTSGKSLEFVTPTLGDFLAPEEELVARHVVLTGARLLFGRLFLRFLSAVIKREELVRFTSLILQDVLYRQHKILPRISKVKTRFALCSRPDWFSPVPTILLSEPCTPVARSNTPTRRISKV